MPTPTQPAPVSGPGALARRTDGGPGDRVKQALRDLPNAQYGEGKTFRELQQGAPLPQQSAPQDGAAPAGPVQMPTPLGAPTQRPDEPVTAGAPVGAGPDSIPGFNTPALQQEDLQRLAGYLPALEAAANVGDAPKSFRLFVQYLKGFTN